MTENYEDLELLEQASKLCHIEWMDWTKNISNELNDIVKVLENNIQYLNEKNNMDDITRDKLLKENLELTQRITDRLARWESLWIPYEDLSEDMKEADRVYARKILELKND